jgi:hypothetical protein
MVYTKPLHELNADVGIDWRCGKTLATKVVEIGTVPRHEGVVLQSGRAARRSRLAHNQSALVTKQ